MGDLPPLVRGLGGCPENAGQWKHSQLFRLRRIFAPSAGFRVMSRIKWDDEKDAFLRVCVEKSRSNINKAAFWREVFDHWIEQMPRTSPTALRNRGKKLGLFAEVHDQNKGTLCTNCGAVIQRKTAYTVCARCYQNEYLRNRRKLVGQEC